MNTIELTNYAKTAAINDNSLKDLTEKKIQEFMQYQMSELMRLDTLVETLFTDEIVGLVREFTTGKSTIIAVGEKKELWVDIYNNVLRVRLNPNNYRDSIYWTKAYHEGVIYYPTTLSNLKITIEMFKEYSLLADTLQKNISELYNVLYQYKVMKIDEDFKYLNSLSFGQSNCPQKKYKITVIVEEET